MSSSPPLPFAFPKTPMSQATKVKSVTPARPVIPPSTPASSLASTEVEAALKDSGIFTCKEPEENNQPSLLVMAKDYQFDDSDYDIWSSEFVKFKVHSYRLQAASPYFRKVMKEVKTAKSIGLERTSFSHARVIQVLLDIIYTSEPSGCQDISLAYQVIDLAKHWKCETVLKVLKRDLAIQALINNPVGPCNDQFRLAHRLNDHHLMGLMAQRNRDSTRKLSSTLGIADHTDINKDDAQYLYDRPGDALTGVSGIESPMFEVGGLSYMEFLRLPPTVVWALSRSTYLARRDDCPGDLDVDAMAQQFETLLHQAYSTPSSKAAELPAKPPVVPSTTVPLKQSPE